MTEPKTDMNDMLMCAFGNDNPWKAVKKALARQGGGGSLHKIFFCKLRNVPLYLNAYHIWEGLPTTPAGDTRLVAKWRLMIGY